MTMVLMIVVGLLAVAGLVELWLARRRAARQVVDQTWNRRQDALSRATRSNDVN